MHRSRVSALVIDCDDLEAGVGFWTRALGVKVVEREADGVYVDLGRDATGLQLLLQRVPEPKTAKTRVHLDVETDDVDAEVARLEDLGAHKQAEIEDWWVMEDPCGNEFCVVPVYTADFMTAARPWNL